MNGEWSKRWAERRPWLIAVVVVMWAIFIAHAFRTIPSAESASEHLAEMKADIEYALDGNGWVTRATNESKYGAALAYRLINGSTIDSEKKASIRRRLAELGWRPLMDSTGKYCKHEMLLTFQDDQGASNTASSMILSAEYNLSTAKRCAF